MTVTGFWSREAGTDWEHGLPAGNGVVGALLSGTPERHEITLAHERVVLPTDRPRLAPLLAPDLAEIRALIGAGRAQEAAELGVARAAEQGYPGLQWTDPLVPSATLAVCTPHGEFSGYRRDVDLDRDVVSTRWSQGGEDGAIEMFVSRADHVVIVRLSGSARRGSLSLEAPENVATSSSGVKGGNAERVRFAVGTDDGLRSVRMRFLADWPVRISGSDARMRVLRDDGIVTTVAVSVTPVSRDSPEALQESAHLLLALPTDYEVLLLRHFSALQREVHIANLSLDAPLDDRSIEDLLSDRSPETGRGLIELQYRAAQRLIAGSTGELPPTLQGVWSGTFDPAWSSDYTMNGNVQSGSIASMLGTGNSRQLRTYLDMLDGFAGDFAENSQRLFGTEGYVLPSRCSPTHGACTHFDEKHCHEFWTAGGGWSALYFLDYVWHTGDLDYLRESAYPFAKEVERFYDGFLTRDASGTIVFSPSYSPENRSPSFAAQVCRNATMDRAVLDRLLVGLLRAAELLGIDEDLAERRSEWLDALPRYRVAPDGTLAEWLDTGVVERVGHRTASHLLGTWFEPDRRFVGELKEPVRELIRTKLAWRASGDAREEMAYGLVQLGIAASVIGDGALALECVERMSRLYFLPSLSTTHDVGAIFNVDIAGGFPAVIHAMIIGSAVGEIHLLPAIPAQRPSGRLDGVSVRGGIAVDRLTWTPAHVWMAAHARPGAGALRGGEPITVTAPVGWAFDARDGAAGGRSSLIDPADGDSFFLSARPVSSGGHPLASTVAV